jgi:hypothetical protein
MSLVISHAAFEALIVAGLRRAQRLRKADPNASAAAVRRAASMLRIALTWPAQSAADEAAKARLAAKFSDPTAT